MRKVDSFVLLLVVAFGFSACTMVKSDISRFSSLSDKETGSFLMVPLKKQEGSIEYRTYANTVAGKLIERGFRKVDNLSDADYVVVIDYGVGGSSEVSGSIPIYGQTGGGTTYHSGTVSSYGYGGSSYGTYNGSSYTPPTYGIVGSTPYNYTKYHRYFYLKMYDIKKSTPEKPYSVYEGTVKSSGKSANFSTVSECIINSLFKDFYKTGTENVIVDGSKCIK